MLSNSKWISAAAGVALAACAVASGAHAETKIGSTIDEIVELAKQEPPVVIATTWEGEIIDAAKKGFKEKYGLDLEYVYVAGIDDRERILNEALSGLYDVDLVAVSGELRDKFVRADVIVPVDFLQLFPGINKDIISPNSYFLGTGMNQFIIAYNSKLVSEADAPKDWSDCVDPKWKEKIGVYTRPLGFIQQYFSWGKDKSIEYHTALKANEPVWTSSTNSTAALLASGEFSIVCGLHYHAVKNILREDPAAPIKVIVPKLFPYQVGEALSVMKGGNSPNSAILLAGYLATDGASIYDLFGRSNPMVEGTEAWTNAREAGATPYWSGWDNDGEAQAEAVKVIVETWGFPKAR